MTRRKTKFDKRQLQLQLIDSPLTELAKPKKQRSHRTGKRQGIDVNTPPADSLYNRTAGDLTPEQEAALDKEIAVRAAEVRKDWAPYWEQKRNNFPTEDIVLSPISLAPVPSDSMDS